MGKMQQDIQKEIYHIEAVRVSIEMGGSQAARDLAERIVEARVNYELDRGAISVISVEEGVKNYKFILDRLTGIDKASILIVERGRNGENVFYDGNLSVVKVKTVNEKIRVVIGHSRTVDKHISNIVERAISEDRTEITRFGVREAQGRDIRDVRVGNSNMRFDLTAMRGQDYDLSKLARGVYELAETEFKDIASGINSVQVVTEAEARSLRAILPMGTDLNNVSVVIRGQDNEHRFVISPSVAARIESQQQNRFGSEVKEFVAISLQYETEQKKEDGNLFRKAYRSAMERFVGSDIKIVPFPGQLPDLE
ncbi:MAG: hypothetical protein KAR31_13890, partial [Candidatus Omnitrophica bacterium]|nr:hypothetical protein [Candidatus Omnitrophota bacterium]